MKKYLLLFLCIFLSITVLSAQKKKPKPVQIDKCVWVAPPIHIPSSMCIGECVTVFTGFSSASSIVPADYTVETPSGDVLQFTIDFYDFCPTEIGTYIFNAYLTDAIVQPSTRTVVVTDFFIPTLTTSSIYCLGNYFGLEDDNNCQQVCSGTTAVYVAGNSQGLNLVWEINGAEDFQIEDNQAVITWGSEGYGRVNVSVEEVADPLNINCQPTILPSDIVIGDGQAIIYIEGGEAPFEIIINEPNGDVVLWEGGYGINTLTVLPIGFYSILVVSADGQESNCSFQLGAAGAGGTGCHALPITYVTTQETDEDCYFQWTANVQGGTTPYTYIWSTGATTASILGEEGTNSVTVTDAHGCSNRFTARRDCAPSCMGSNEVCIEILPEPIASFSASIPIENGVIEICSGQTLSFFNESLNTSTYYWNFTPLQGSSVIHPEFTYETAGTYELSLIARNDCYCKDTISVNVVVSDAQVPPISCQGTICQGDVSTYSTPVGCDTYEWSVSNNGVILNGGTAQDTFVQVEWLNGTVGSISLSTPGCSTSNCPEPNVIQIPIIGEEGIITGPESVCPLERVEFRIPPYSGTTLLWSISEGGTIRGASDESQINAYWETSETSDSLWVSISYDNCFLGCGGTDTLWLSIRPDFHLEGLTEWCENQTIEYMALTDATADTILSNWQIQNMEGLVIWQSPTPAFSINEQLNLLPGNYRIQASPDVADNYCKASTSLPFRVKAAPLPPDGIIGLETICPGSTYEYFADGNINTHRFIWYIQSSGSMSIQEGPVAFVSWGDVGPYELQLTQIPLNGLPCESLPVSITPVASSTLTLSGNLSACVDELSIYTVITNDNDAVNWRLEPVSIGSILPGSSNTQIEVYWNEAGVAQVIANACGLEESLMVVVNDYPEPIVLHPMAICQGSSTVVATIDSYTTYRWFNTQGQLLSENATPVLSAGNYNLIVVNAEGCEGRASFTIEEWLLPKARISTGAYPALCDAGAGVTILALEEEESYQYEWFHDGQLLAENSSTLNASQPGLYWVEVIDLNSCSAISNTINLQACEVVGGMCVDGLCLPEGTGPPSNPTGGSCIVNGVIDFTHNLLQCDEVLFTNMYNDFLPGSLSWNFSDPESGGQNTSSINNPIHIFSFPGIYPVIMRGEVNSTLADVNCLVGVFENIRVPARAEFDFSSACANQPVNFVNRSVFLPQESISAWNWDFGDPSSPDNTANVPEPMHLFSTPGIYLVTLTIEMASGCSSSTTQLISIEEVTTGGIQLPTVSCVQTALLFEVATPAIDLLYDWEFEDQFGNVLSTAKGLAVWQTFQNPTTYTIRLITTNAVGCQSEETILFLIHDNTLNGEIDIAPNPVVCAGDSIVLQAPADGSSWLWQDGSTTESVTFFTNTIASVSLANANGCNYAPPVVALNFLTPPFASIQVVEYNEFGQVIQTINNSTTICEGEEIFFLTQENEYYEYLWSNGDTENGTGFYDERDTLLPIGIHTIDLTVLDTRTGCSFMTPPFQVTVHPSPERPEGSAIYPACEGELNTLYVEEAVDSLLYLWSDGQIGDTIQVVVGGNHYVYAQNEFGCISQKDKAGYVRRAPNLDLVPRGCFTICRQDTICVPDIPFVNAYRWYFEGVAIEGIAGARRELVVNEEGEYWLEVRTGSSQFPCYFQSPSIFIEFEEGFGDIMGGVYFDINNNGIIDASDSLGIGHQIELLDTSTNLITTINTDSLGHYLLDSLSSDQHYIITLDTIGLGIGWYIETISYEQMLVGCGDVSATSWLISPNCAANFEVLDIALCPGEQVLIGAEYYVPGDSILISIDIEAACDSFILVDIASLRSDSFALEAFICEGSFYDHYGTLIPPDEIVPFYYTNTLGCDSTVTIQTFTQSAYESFDTLYSCPNIPVDYEGEDLLPGSLQQFELQSVNGCDSVVWIQVDAYQTSLDTINLWGCPGEMITYANTQLLVGDSLLLGYQNLVGCDSSVMIYTYQYPTQLDTIRPQICQGDFYMYDNMAIGVDEQQAFVYSNEFGCDSTLVIAVDAFPPIPDLEWNIEKSCWNINTGSLSLNTAPIQGMLYSLDQNNWQNEAEFMDLPVGIHQVHIRDENNCEGSQMLNVASTPPLNVIVQDTLMNCSDLEITVEPIVNFPSTTLTWEWPDGSVFDTWILTTPGEYTFLTTNVCETIETKFEVNWSNEYPESFFYLPNVFSPNDDGINDTWKALGIENLQIESFDLKIFDRWGDLMFEGNSINQAWNGTFRSKKLDPAVFVAIIEVDLFYCGQRIKWRKSQDVLILK